jgi:ADP-ribose pyrophosphatase YjhB (NUDIX family)
VDDLATRGHAIVLIDTDRVVLLREVRSGVVRYLAPGARVEPGGTPGQAAVRAARDVLGVDVEVARLLFADTEMGAEHYFFLTRLLSPSKESWDAPAPAGDGVTPTAIRRSLARAYPVRPAQLVPRLGSTELWRSPSDEAATCGSSPGRHHIFTTAEHLGRPGASRLASVEATEDRSQ